MAHDQREGGLSMARIPMGDFGQRLPETRTTPTASAGQLDAGLSDATQRLGNTAMNIGSQMLDEKRREAEKLAAQAAADAKREQEKQAARAERVSQLTAHATIQTGLADLHDEITAGVTDGTLNQLDARKQWTERSAKVVGDQVAQLPPDLGTLVNAEMMGLTGRLNNSLEDTYRKRNQQDADAGLMTYKEQMQRFAGTDMAAAVKQWESVARESGAQAGWSPERIAKEVQGFRETVSYTKGYEAVSTARNDRKGLDRAEALIGQLPDLDPQKRAVLMDRVASYKLALDQKAELAAQRGARQAEASMRRAESAFNTFQALADKGTVLDPAYIDQVVSQTAGTPYQAGVRALAQQAVDSGGFAAQPISAQQSALDAVNAQIAKSGRSPALDKRKEQIEKVLIGSKSDLEKSGGLRAAVERGVIDQIAPLDVRSVDGLTQGLAARVEQADTVGRSWAGSSVSPLLPEEADALAGTLGNLAPAARSTFIATLSKAVPPKQLAALARQIDGKDRALALSMALGTSGTSAGRYTSELVIKGAQAIKDKGVKLDSSAVTGTRARAAEYLGDAVQGKAREDVLDTAALIFAGMEAEGSGDINRAVRLAVGGDVIERNGKKIPIPAGIDPDKFEAAVQGTARRAVGTGQVYVSGKAMDAETFLKALPGADLQPVGSGRYVVRSGSGLVTVDGKKPLVLGVTNATP
jgi:hypothetical protein